MHRSEKIAGISSRQLSALLNSDERFFLKKHGRSTTVGRVNGDVLGLPCNVWVKRFNNKGTIDFLLKRIFGSRAKHLWRISKEMCKRELPVPMPIAYFEPSLEQKDSFFLSSVVEHAVSLGELYKNGQFHDPESIAQRLGETMAKWHMAGAVHGDMKWPNIMRQVESGSINFYFVDLDQAKLYNKPNVQGIIKDLIRFYRYGLELGTEKWVDTLFLPAYFAALSSELKDQIAAVDIKNKALKAWCKKGRRRL
ncbi:MAG: lipopolysaccharide kinase InaA family protein [Nitrospirota bacterium]